MAESSTASVSFGERSTLGKARFVLFYLAIVAAAAMTLAFLTELLPLLVLGWTAGVGAELGIHRLHIMGIALVIATVLVGLFVQVYRPHERVASLWGSLVVMTVITLATLGFGAGRPEEVVPFFVVTGVAILTHPAGRGVLRRGDSFSPALLALAVVAAVPLLAYVGNQLVLQVSADSHALSGHYLMMAGAGVAPVALALAAGMGLAGWRLAAWQAALVAAYFGAMSVAFPAQASSVGMTGGVAVLVWAVAFVAVAEFSRGAGVSETFRRRVAGSS
ncbi:hypothetical protein [Haloglomus litoreum]|uniref:hypothetical protein n=1 Tax=Haloglomus litoreum TaxID=3034026 RepID=UPI0023E8B9E9|nr:hypothetical protein [Haloglomus sp. DT116]